jgi:hypothetical protein
LEEYTEKGQILKDNIVKDWEEWSICWMNTHGVSESLLFNGKHQFFSYIMERTSCIQ